MIKIKSPLSLKKLPFNINYKILKNNRLGVFSFLFAFTIMFLFINITLARNAVIRNIKAQLSQAIQNLNEIGLDISYENLEFNNIFIYPILEAHNFQIYNLQGNALWNVRFPDLTVHSSLFNAQNLKIKFSNYAELRYNAQNYPTTFENTNIQLTLDEKSHLEVLKTDLENINIKNFAKIQSLIWHLNKIETSVKAPVMLPTTESSLEINNIALNGLLNYPLTSQIRRIFIKANVIGRIDADNSFLLSAENWLQSGGFIEIPSFMISWDPLLMVGRGSVTFNEKFSPQIQLHTSSKAIQELLNDLLKIDFIEKKGTFVANILLGAKSFKLKKEDKHLTVSTPITYSDGKLAIENVTIKTIQ